MTSGGAANAIDPAVQDAADRLAAGEAEAALDILMPIVAANDADVPARFVLAMTAWKLGRLDWAIELLKACHAMAPMNGAIAEALASLHAQVGDLVESVYVAKVATAIGEPGELAALMPPGFPSFDRAFAAIREQPLFEQARLMLAGGRVQDAIDKVRQHLAIASYDRAARAFYATALLRAGRPSEVLDALAPLVGATMPASLASVEARSLAAMGEQAAATRRHDEAATLAPEDAAIAAMKILDGVWLGAPDLAAQGTRWAVRFCPPRKPPQLRRPETRMVIAYMVAAFADPSDAAAVADVARAHDRSRVKVIGYGTGAQSWPENVALRGAFETWQDIGTLDAATLVRFFAHDRVSVVIDAAGFAAPQSLMALARLRTALRVSWLGNVPALRQPVYDAAIAATALNAGRDDWVIPGGYPLPTPMRQVPPDPHDHVVFGSDVLLPQLDEATVASWSAILRVVPEAKLLLRRGDDLGKRVIDGLVARFGSEMAARIDIVAVDRNEDFFARIDIALAPRCGLSARFAAEAVGCGVPVVAFGGGSRAEPYGDFLRGIGLGATLVAADEREYESVALTLTRSPAARSSIDASSHDAAHFARAIEENAIRALAACASS